MGQTKGGYWGTGTLTGTFQYVNHVMTVTLTRALGWVDPNGDSVDAPVGFVSDGATIPSIFWSAVGGPFDGPYADAAVIHDFGLSEQPRYGDVWVIHLRFYRCMKASGVPAWKASAFFLAVCANTAFRRVLGKA